MHRSYNGWPVIERAGCRTIHVPGSDVRFAVVDDDDVAVVFQAVAAWVDARVEDIDTRAGVRGFDVPDDWGHAVRLTRGSSTSWSNHASGTAIDVNAVQHPRGVAKTWTAAQKSSIRTVLSRLGGAVRWGEDYRSPSVIDGMHFEIATADRRLLQRAAAGARDVLTELFPPTVQEDDDMPTAREIVDELLARPLKLGGGNQAALDRLTGVKGATLTVADALAAGALRSWEGVNAGRALGSAFTEVAAAGGADTARLVAAARQGAADALTGATLTVQPAKPTDGHAVTPGR